MLHVLIDEEYGFRTWMWMFPGTIEELIRAWKREEYPFGNKPYQGIIKEIINPIGPGMVNSLGINYDAYIHSHREDDTHLVIENVMYHADGRVVIMGTFGKYYKRNHYEKVE